MENAHTAALMAKHAGLEARLVDETHRPAPDDRVISELKKQKLRIKEMLARG